MDVVFDGIGGSNLWRSREALRPGGKIVVYGFTSKLRGGRLASGRSGGRHRFRELARSHLVPLGTQPPAAATRALSYFEEGNTTLAREAALSGLVEEYSGQSFHHSKGDPRAICMAVVGFADLAEGQHDAALAWADRAIATDSRCPIGWLAKARVLLSQDRVDDAFSAAADGMRHQPGDPDLYEWYQELRLQRGQRASAAAVQEEMRNALLSRNKETLLYRYDP